jgi:hypothetical protein
MLRLNISDDYYFRHWPLSWVPRNTEVLVKNHGTSDVRFALSAEHIGPYTFGPCRESKCFEEHKIMDTVESNRDV